MSLGQMDGICFKTISVIKTDNSLDILKACMNRLDIKVSLDSF